MIPLRLYLRTITPVECYNARPVAPSTCHPTGRDLAASAMVDQDNAATFTATLAHELFSTPQGMGPGRALDGSLQCHPLLVTTDRHMEASHSA